MLKYLLQVPPEDHPPRKPSSPSKSLSQKSSSASPSSPASLKRKGDDIRSLQQIEPKRIFLLDESDNEKSNSRSILDKKNDSRNDNNNNNNNSKKVIVFSADSYDSNQEEDLDLEEAIQSDNESVASDDYVQEVIESR